MGNNKSDQNKKVVTIDTRNSRFDKDFKKIPLIKGMCFTGKVDEDGNLVKNEACTYPDFIWIFIAVNNYGIVAVETSHNNVYTIDFSEISGYELVKEDVHVKHNEISPDYINKVLTGFYDSE